MKKLIPIILILILQSCIITNFEPVSNNFEIKKILSDTTKSYLYRTQFKLYNNDFSGLIIIKPQNTGHRIIFINEIGMKFFDIELIENSYSVHHIFDPMNKKMFIKLLVGDFNFILMNDIKNNYQLMRKKQSDYPAIILKKDKEVYIFDKNTLLPDSAFKYSIFRKNVFLNYSDFKNEIPKHIKIKHKNIKFEMNLTFIK